METKGGKKKSSSSSSSNSNNSQQQYEVPLGYSIEDIRPNGGIEKFRSAAYSNVILFTFINPKPSFILFHITIIFTYSFIVFLQCVRKPSWDEFHANASFHRLGFQILCSKFSPLIFFLWKSQKKK